MRNLNCVLGLTRIRFRKQLRKRLMIWSGAMIVIPKRKARAR